MTFTYNLSTDIGFIRLKIGDTRSGSGPRPQQHNFMDEEIQAILTAEDTTSATIASLLEVLANEWAVVADKTVGPRQESFSQIAKAFAARAREETLSVGLGLGISFVGGFKKVDGYSDDGMDVTIV